MIGVYCLANDVPYEHFLALVKSFRKYNPKLPLTVIKFNDVCEKLEALADKYSFKIWEPAHGNEMYEIGLKINPQSKTVATFFKKICSFWGEYDTFIYLDCDIVVVDDFTPILQNLEKSGNDVLYWDSDDEWVYKEGAYRDKMTQVYNSAHMNAGIFGGKKNAIKFSEVEEMMASLTPEDYEALIWADQSFLNYCCDIKQLKKIQLHKLLPERAFTAWYNYDIQYKDGGYYCLDKKFYGRMTAVHWAGRNFSNIYQHHTGLIFLRCRLIDESLYKKYRYFLNFYHIRTIDLFREGRIVSLIRLLFNF